MNTNTKHWASITAGILSLAGHASAEIVGYEKYTYDASGNIVEKQIDGKVTKMTFDQSNRLIEKQNHGQSRNSLSYDEAGHPIAEISEHGQELRGMIYGYGGKVLETKEQGRKARLYYNAEGQLIGKSNNAMISTYSWDGIALASSDSEAFTNEAHLTGGVPVITGDLAVVVSDYLGSTLSQGNCNLTSSAYGEGLESGRFTGKPFVSELGSYVFQNRLYSSESNHWNIPDPSGFPDGINSRSYVNGSPLEKIDPLGLEEVPVQATSYGEFDIHSNAPGYVIPSANPPQPYKPNIQFKMTSTYSKEPDKAELVTIGGAGTPATGWSWSDPSAALVLPDAQPSTAAHNGDPEGKKMWTDVRFDFWAKYNRPSGATGGELHQLLTLGQKNFFTEYARKEQ